MNLSPALEKVYTQERLSARDAQRQAQFIAFGPIVFQVSRLMVKFGILDLLRESSEGLTMPEIAEKTKLSPYAVKVLMEASLSIGTVLVDSATDRFSLSKTGWFFLTDASTQVNVAFNHDVNYEGWFHLEEALKEGRPAGLKHFGEWPTVYEGLSRLPEEVQKSWFGFDHFYSDNSFDEALPIVFSRPTGHLLDVGGNTGRWALRCVAYDPQTEVTIMDLPQQLEMMQMHQCCSPFLHYHYYHYFLLYCLFCYFPLLIQRFRLVLLDPKMKNLQDHLMQLILFYFEHLKERLEMKQIRYCCHSFDYHLHHHLYSFVQLGSLFA